MTAESTVDTTIILEHPRATNGGVLWRNNVGSLLDRRGIPVRYGLANDSKKMNQYVKSSDRIGFTPVKITADMVGQVVAVFTAIEMKESDWVFPNPTNKREYEHCVAQLRFHDIVRGGGGFAGFATNVNDYYQIIKLKP